MTHLARSARGLAAVAVVLFVVPRLPAQGLLAPADRELIQALQAGISRDNLQRGLDAFAPLDRISGGPGEAAAARYLERELTRLGIPYQVHRLRLYLSWPVKASLDVGGRSLTAVTPSFSTSTPAAGVTGQPVLFGASGHPFTGEGRSERKADVRGKIAVIDGLIEPQDAEAAERAGAIAVVNINTTDLLHEMIASTVWGTPGVENTGRMPGIPILSVTRSDGVAVQEVMARGGAVTVHTLLDTGWKEAPLVVAEVRGASDEFILLSAHLDAWYAGMSDTGGGDIALLEFARLLHERRSQLKRSVRIAWWVGHSTGRYAGSTWYADHHWQELDQKCVGYVNLDGPGTRGVPLDRASTWAWPELLDFVDGLARELTGKEPIHEYVSANPERIRPPRAGDSSFQGLGVPEFSLGVAELAEDHPDRRPYVGGSQGAWWWHTKDDTVDKLDLNVIVQDLQWRLPSLVALLNARVLPYRLSNTARLYRTALDEYATNRFDLSGTRAMADQLEQAALALEARSVDRPGGLSDAEAARVNRLLLRASHLLNATLYSGAGRFHHDPAFPQPLLPPLAGLQALKTADPGSDRYGFLEASLVRGRNQVESALREATELLRHGLPAGT